MFERSTMKPICCIRYYKEASRKKRKLYIVFIDLEKAYGRVPKRDFKVDINNEKITKGIRECN